MSASISIFQVVQDGAPEMHMCITSHLLAVAREWDLVMTGRGLWVTGSELRWGTYEMGSKRSGGGNDPIGTPFNVLISVIQ